MRVLMINPFATYGIGERETQALRAALLLLASLAIVAGCDSRSWEEINEDAEEE